MLTREIVRAVAGRHESSVVAPRRGGPSSLVPSAGLPWWRMTQPAPAPDVRRIVLVGLMASGKTTVGRALAAHLGWQFDDSDASIEAATG